jgi:hypothetical protein
LLLFCLRLVRRFSRGGRSSSSHPSASGEIAAEPLRSTDI